MWVSFVLFLGQSSAHPEYEFKAISVLASSSSKSLLCLPSHLTIWDNKIKKERKHIIISSASLPTFRHHCNSASDVNIWAWFSFNGFNNKIQSNVNKWFVKVFYLFQHKAFEGENTRKELVDCSRWTEEGVKAWLSEWCSAAITEREPALRLLGRNRTLWARSSWRNTLWREGEESININQLILLFLKLQSYIFELKKKNSN